MSQIFFLKKEKMEREKHEVFQVALFGDYFCGNVDRYLHCVGQQGSCGLVGN